MSRQMAFQMTGHQVIEAVKKVLSVKDDDPTVKLADWIELVAEDQKERERLLAAFLAADKCQKVGREITRISKVIVWRDANGKPSDLQIEFHRR